MEDKLPFSRFFSTEKIHSPRFRSGRRLGFSAVLLAVALTAVSFWRFLPPGGKETARDLYGKAAAWIQQSQNDRALLEIDTLLRDYPHSREAALAYVLRGDLRARAGDFPGAARDYAAALPQRSAEERISARMAISVALAYRGLDKDADALREMKNLDPVIQSLPLKHLLAYIKGGIYEDLCNPAKALECYKSIPAGSEWHILALERVRWLEAEPAGAVNP